ncbi:MAG: MFS transporter [Sporomusaceae bacterium]|nr:MFS transporter [Sporomusaceae bacterium]
MKQDQKNSQQISTWITVLLAVACGVIVANLYYAQPLIGPISTATGLPLSLAGFIVTLTQIGYVIGLLFIVPLSDLIENRRLVFILLIALIAALIGAAQITNAFFFLATALLLGLGSVATQILVPYAAHLAPEEKRGQAVGNVMSGLLLGIMLSRPLASLVTGLWSWQIIFLISAILTALLALLLAFFLPKRTPVPTLSYRRLLLSLISLFATKPLLRRRAFYQACLFGSFSLFWTVIPLWLTHHFHLSQQEIALFALAGVAGAVAAPIAGRLADKGWTKPLTGLAIVIAILSFLLTNITSEPSHFALTILVIAAIALDMAVSGNLVLGQRVIYSLGSEIRGRVNGVFMAVFFMGGAAGSSLGGWSYAYGGWFAASLLGLILPIIALIYFFTEKTK